MSTLSPTPTDCQLLPSCAPAWSLALQDLILAETATSLDMMRADPALLMRLAGMEPDPWQAGLLRADWPRTLLLCSRQSGKSTTAAALALREILLEDDALVLLLSPTQRQSGELFRDKVLRLYDALRRPVEAARETQTELVLINGSRVVSLPENEAGIRGFSGVRLLIIDEASRVGDALYYAVRPMLATSGGRLVALSTPFGKQGWYFDAWEGSGPWQRVKVTAEDCPRIPKEFLEEEKRALGKRWYSQEYLCTFEETIDAVFSMEDFRRSFAEGVGTYDLL